MLTELDRGKAVRIALPILAVAALAAIKPEIVRGTFSSPGSALRVGALVVGYMVFSRLMGKVIPNRWAAMAVVAVPAAALLWWNVAPYFEDDVKIASSFPETFTTMPEPDTAAAAANEPAPHAAAPQQQAAPTAPAAPAGPVQLTSGRFTGLDGHRGAGEASIFRLPDGSHVVAFRDLSVSSVPDPVLYVVPGAGRESTSGGVRLGAFDGGKDRYEIPAGTDVNQPLTVLIWCQRFAVPVAGATQTPV